ncbi:MAG: hypothetical protein C4519_22400 [Desulfobacteraceae bacterium]|nr:MAG: hypothetical protein C4519_22400 [Desulfobacteraceae bacterium]
MAKKRISRKELVKGPDEFITLTGKVILWARNNTKPLFIGICAILALIILLSGYRVYNNRRGQAAAVLLSQTLGAYQEAQSREEDPDKAFAVVKQDFNRLLNEYGRQPAGRAGRIIFAHAALSGHSADEAIALYRKALMDFGRDSSMLNILRNGLASALLQKGDRAAAIEEFRKIADGNSTLLKDAALFHLGYLYSAAGEAEKSRKAYQQLGTDFPNSIYAGIAKERASG